MKKHLFLLISLLLILSGCLKNSDKALIETNQDIEGKSFSFSIIKGDNWSHKKKFGPVTVKIKPQFAIWTETPDGKYLQTIYITKSFAKQNWRLADYDPDKTLRTMCMPYWFNKYLESGLTPPSKNKPFPDSISSATPVSDFILDTKIKGTSNNIIILAEFNKSFDPNETFNENREVSKINGQPSVIYSAEIDLSKPNIEYIMKLAGHGGETAEDGSLYKDTESLTTAKNIVKEIKIKVLNP